MNNDILKNRAYVYAYNCILLHPLYDKNFFSNYSKFKEFCEKNLSDNKLKKIISDKICEYYLSHNSKTGEINEPITYFKFVYRKKV